MKLLTAISLVLLLAAHGSNAASRKENVAGLEEYFEDKHPARLMKDHDPIAAASYHEDDPVVAESVEGGENLPRIVRNRGPLTKKVVATGSHFPGLDFSMVAWKFADGTFKGTMEEKLDSGDVHVRVEVDCMEVNNGYAIVGGVVTKANRSKPDDFLNTRAYALVVDDPAKKRQEISGLLLNFADDVGCKLDSQKLESTATMHRGEVTVCNRRDGEAAWLKCVDNMKKLNEDVVS